MTTAPPNGIAFVDLDGTATLENSFHTFLLALWQMGNRRSRLLLLFALARRLLLPRYGRAEMKHAALRAYVTMTPARQVAITDETVDRIVRNASAPIMNRVSDLRSRNWLIVLATAAPVCYAAEFANRLGFDHCLATPMPTRSQVWNELIGSAKAEACEEWMIRAAPRVAEVVVMTDHVDDLPLLQLASSAVFQGSPEKYDQVRTSLPACVDLELIDTMSTQASGGLWLWFDDQASGPHDAWEIRTILSKHRYALLYVGRGTWLRVAPGDDLAAAAARVDCPIPPSMFTRIRIAARRSVVRNQLGIFH